ncbi:MAG: PAS domain S-box-containing protein [Chlamydiales bacterium]|jgi:PAS domain S-box-containing protein
MSFIANCCSTLFSCCPSVTLKYCPSTKAVETVDSLRPPEFSRYVPLDALLNVIIISNPKGKICAINKFGREKLGYSKGELPGKEITILMLDGDKHGHPQYMRNYHGRSQNTSELESEITPMNSNRIIRVKRKDGSTFPAKISICQNNESRLGPQIIASIIDCTSEEERLQVESRKTNLILHDAQGPLSVIKQASQELCSSPKLRKSDVELVSFIQTAASSLHDLVNINLELAKLEQSDEIPVSNCLLRDQFSRTLTLSQRSAQIKGRNLRIINNIPQDAYYSIATKHFDRVLYNLLSNAIKFTPESSGNPIICELKVDTIIDREGEEIQVLCFKVSNEGPGFTREQKERIFTPYKQASDQIASEYGGTGLGLYKCKQILKKAKGLLDARSVPGGITTFFGYIPIQEQVQISISKSTIEPHPLGFIQKFSIERKEQESSPNIHLLSEASPNIREKIKEQYPPRRILYVEDQVLERRLTLRTLNTFGHTVITASSVEEALKLLDDAQVMGDDDFDLVITDMNMGDQNGFDLSNALRGPGRNFQGGILLLSGTVTNQTVADALAHKINGCLSKGSSPEILKREIEKVVVASLLPPLHFQSTIVPFYLPMNVGFVI